VANNPGQWRGARHWHLGVLSRSLSDQRHYGGYDLDACRSAVFRRRRRRWDCSQTATRTASGGRLAGSAAAAWIVDLARSRIPDACGRHGIGIVRADRLDRHLYSLLVPALGSQQAGLAMGLATASAVAGRTLVGWLMPAGADRRLVACVSYAVQIAGSAAFSFVAGTSVPSLLLGVVLFDSSIGNATSLPPLIA
jgi:hypothetical protein